MLNAIRLHCGIDAITFRHPLSRKKPAVINEVDQTKPPAYANLANTEYLIREVPATRAVRCLTPGMKYPIKSPTVRDVRAIHGLVRFFPR